MSVGEAGGSVVFNEVVNLARPGSAVSQGYMRDTARRHNVERLGRRRGECPSLRIDAELLAKRINSVAKGIQRLGKERGAVPDGIEIGNFEGQLLIPSSGRNVAFFNRQDQLLKIEVGGGGVESSTRHNHHHQVLGEQQTGSWIRLNDRYDFLRILNLSGH